MSALALLTPTLHHAHDPGASHPERPARVEAAGRGVAGAELEHLRFGAGRTATLDELSRVHDRSYLDGLAAMDRAGGGELDPDTPVGPGSWAAAEESAGLGLEAVDLLDRDAATAAFVLPRPPGHHASSAAGMGFCLLNNVAVTAAHLRARGERVLIVDWDVHHGNGTQAIFWDDPDVLFCSLHQWPAYPGTGRAEEVGGCSAPGRTVNIPLPPGSTGDVVLAGMDEVIAPEVDRFRPHWVLISAGFDAHRRDPLGGLQLTSGDFGLLASRVAAFAPAPGRIVAFLEGGYDLQALERSSAAVAAALLGQTLHPERPSGGGPGRPLIADCTARRHRALELAW
jgi:acetoin utilization deacetylase AcuC-like enzyme